MDVTNKVLVKKYNKNDFRFYEYFRNHLSNIGVDEMEQLHKKLPKDFMPNKKVNVQNDQDLKIYEYLYSIDRGYSLKSSEEKGPLCQKSFEEMQDKVFDLTSWKTNVTKFVWIMLTTMVGLIAKVIYDMVGK